MYGDFYLFKENTRKCTHTFSTNWCSEGIPNTYKKTGKSNDDMLEIVKRILKLNSIDQYWLIFLNSTNREAITWGNLIYIEPSFSFKNVWKEPINCRLLHVFIFSKSWKTHLMFFSYNYNTKYFSSSFISDTKKVASGWQSCLKCALMGYSTSHSLGSNPTHDDISGVDPIIWESLSECSVI